MPILSTTLTRAWVALAGLSALAALVSAMSGQGIPVYVAAGGILLLALAKARVILSLYLGLTRAPGWLTGFFTVITLWALVVLGLYLVPVFVA